MDGVSLSSSCLWFAQKQFYDAHGIESWNVVPEYMTSNCFIAAQYSRLIVSYLRDLGSDIVRDKPVYVLEIGAGTGKFAFLLIKQLLLSLSEAPGLENIKICYILSDFSSSITDFWARCGHFKKWIDQGNVDFCVLDAEKWRSEHGIDLLCSKCKLNATTANPVICIANYLFDSLKHDAFNINENTKQLAQWKLSIDSELQPADPHFLPSVVETSALQWSIEDIDVIEIESNVESYYIEPSLNHILFWYQETLGGESDGASFVFPVGSILLLNELRKFSPGMLLLGGDKADCFPLEFEGSGELPPITSHEGCFSFTTNFDAIAKYFALYGGTSLHGSRDTEFRLSSFVLPISTQSKVFSNFRDIPSVDRVKEHFPCLYTSFKEMLHFGPEHYFNIFSGASFLKKKYKAILKMGKETEYSMSRDVAMAEYFRFIDSQLHLSCYDVNLFFEYRKALACCALWLSEREQKQLRILLYRIWANEYYIPNVSVDISLPIAEIFRCMDLPQAAAVFYETSISRATGTEEELFNTLYNASLCFIDINNTKKARKYLKRCNAIDPCDEDVLAQLSATKRKKSKEMISKPTQIHFKSRQDAYNKDDKIVLDPMASGNLLRCKKKYQGL